MHGNHSFNGHHWAIFLSSPTLPSVTHLIPRYVVNGYGTDESGNCSDSVRQSHQNTRVLRSNVQVVDIISRHGECTGSHAKRKCSDGTRLRMNKELDR